MVKTRLITLALVGLMSMGGSGLTAHAAELSSKTPPTISFDKEEKQAELAEKSATVTSQKIVFEKKGIAFEEAMLAMQEKLLASGKTQEQIDAMLEKFTQKFEELKLEKGEEIALKQGEKDANIAARAEKGITKDTNKINNVI